MVPSIEGVGTTEVSPTKVRNIRAMTRARSRILRERRSRDVLAVGCGSRASGASAATADDSARRSRSNGTKVKNLARNMALNNCLNSYSPQDYGTTIRQNA